MAIDITVRLDPKIKRELKRNGEQWAKQMEWATKDMRRSGPTIVRRRTAQVYAFKQSEMNPKRGKTIGSCSLSGGITDLQLHYSGRMLTPKHFNMSPTEATGRKYTIRATILKGSRVEIGRWQRPWSAGGAYGHRASPMFMPRKVPPISREGGRTIRKGRKFSHAGGKYEAVKVISVPQMVGSERHIDGTMEELKRRQMEILQRRLRGLGIV